MGLEHSEAGATRGGGSRGAMHRCAAKCCDNNDLSVERVHHCVENCSVELNNAQKYVQGEFEHLQNRLQRCVMQCNDEIRDKIGPNSTDAEMSQHTLAFERCAAKCVDSHLGLIPTIMKKMSEVLSQGKYQKQ
ncbi:protein FAM136A isoform X5 [Periplaneta americana]|uniref:protein FAM136A isoform X5 n=1 Tax=Periplaneta americana TaxID=6978 RepID=UPI0037E71672